MGKMCNDCWLSMQNCHDMSICCESEEYDGDECGWFEPIEDHTQLEYNPIRPIKYPSTERSFLRDESCQSNIIGKDNSKILGIFCYDAKT